MVAVGDELLRAFKRLIVDNLKHIYLNVDHIKNTCFRMLHRNHFNKGNNH